MTVLKSLSVTVCGVRITLRVMFVWRHCVSLEGKDSQFDGFDSLLIFIQVG